MPPLHTGLSPSSLNLNWAGLVGLAGGPEVMSAMQTIPFYEGRGWLGWYNAPGGLTAARQFGRSANSRFWASLFPGPGDPPAVVLGLDGMRGPKYINAFSGTTMEIGHLGHLTMLQSKRPLDEETDIIEGRETFPVGISYLAMKHVDYDAPVKRLPLKYASRGLLPIAISIVTCIMCALVYDWISFSVILLGIISSGLANIVIGKGMLVIKSVKEPVSGSPPGHGILVREEVVVIKGKERDVNAITMGRFDLEYGKKWVVDPEQSGEGRKEGKDPKRGRKTNSKYVLRRNHDIGLCSLLLAAQFLVQLFAVSQGTPFGQIMFATSLLVSWLYCTHLSLKKEKIQAALLFRWLGNPEIRHFRAGTRTTMAVFVCLLLFHGIESSFPERDRELRSTVLKLFIPNESHIWLLWRQKVVGQILHLDEVGPLPYLDEEDQEFQVLSEGERILLRELLGDARDAIDKYLNIRADLPKDSSTSD